MFARADCGLDRRRAGASDETPCRRFIALTEHAHRVNNGAPTVLRRTDPRPGAVRPRLPHRGCGQIRSGRHVTSSRTMRAGLPAATQWGGTVPVTTACAPMMALSPTTEPLRSVA